MSLTRKVGCKDVDVDHLLAEANQNQTRSLLRITQTHTHSLVLIKNSTESDFLNLENISVFSM